MAPHTPQLSSPPGGAGGLLGHARFGGGPDMAPHSAGYFFCQ
jgi:hypothetical protein